MIIDPDQVAVGVEGGGPGGAGGGVILLAIRKAALPFEIVSSVQKPTNVGGPASDMENVARTLL